MPLTLILLISPGGYAGVMRFALALLFLSSCTPALTIRRLAPPAGALGPGRTVSLTVSAAPCGDGALEVALDEARFTEQVIPASKVDPELEAKVAAVVASGGFTSDATVPQKLLTAGFKTRVTFTQQDGVVMYRRPQNLEKSVVGTMAEFSRQVTRELAAAFEEQLSRHAPFAPVLLEGGGPLNAGLALLHESKWKEARDSFHKLAQEQPDLDGAWYDLGFASEVQGDWSAALTAYREALKRAPQKSHYEEAATIAANVLTLH